MAKYVIKTPNPKFKGERLGCKFYNGEHVCTCNDKRKIEQFKAFGYIVEEVKEPKPEPNKVEEKPKRQRKK